jgi:hypothetical protein
MAWAVPSLAVLVSAALLWEEQSLCLPQWEELVLCLLQWAAMAWAVLLLAAPLLAA